MVKQARSVNHKAMKRACDMRKQLLNYITKLGMPVVSCGRDSKVLQGYPTHKKQPPP